MKKFISGFIIISLLSVISVYLYFYSVYSKDHKMLDQIEQKAYNEVPILYKIIDIHLFSGEDQYYMLNGKDHLGNPLLIWISDKEVNYKVLKKWFTTEEISKKVFLKEGKIEIKRIIPGVLSKKTLIYEVFYQDIDGRLGYQYYNLETGEFIKKIKLGKAV